MANNVAVTQGSGTSMATDDVGGVHYPYVKLAFGADNTATIASAADPYPVEVVSGALSLTGEDHIGQVGGHIAVIRPTLTVTAGAYSAGDVVSARQTLTSAMRTSGGSGVLQDIIITCADGEAWQGSVVIFNSATASAIADNAAFAWGSGDHAKLAAHIPFAAAEWTTWAGDTVLHLRNLSICISAVGSADLYAYLICTATPTFSATTDVEIAYKFIQN